MIRAFLLKNLLNASRKNKKRLKFFADVGIFLIIAALISSGISIFCSILSTNIISAEVVEEINVKGNQRISAETIEMFSEVSINDDLTEKDLNEILKKLYDTNFFDLVSVFCSLFSVGSFFIIF